MRVRSWLSLLVLTGCANVGPGAPLVPDVLDDAVASKADQMGAEPDDRMCGATVDSDGDGVDDQTWEYRYDKRGLEVEDILRDDHGAVLEDDAYGYDAQGRFASWRSTMPETPSFLYQWHYDDRGRLVETTEDKDGDGVIDYRRTTTVFDAHDKPIAQEIVDLDKKTSVVILRDGHGRLVSERRDQDEDGTIDLTRTCLYDDVALMRVCTTVKPDGVVIYNFVDTYRSDGQLERELATLPSGHSRFEPSYDARGRLVSDTDTSDDGSFAKTSYRYCR
jgi:hypothetical protein